MFLPLCPLGHCTPPSDLLEWLCACIAFRKWQAPYFHYYSNYILPSRVHESSPPCIEPKETVWCTVPRTTSKPALTNKSVSHLAMVTPPICDLGYWVTHRYHQLWLQLKKIKDYTGTILLYLSETKARVAYLTIIQENIYRSHSLKLEEATDQTV
jgi:hypothetical protein